MDTDRFDRLTRQLAQTPSRRQVLKGLGSGLVAGMLTALGRSDALADACKADGKACKRGDQCCSGTCDAGTGTGSTAKSSGVCRSCTSNTGTCTANGDCCSGICQGRTCVATVAGTCTAATGGCGNGSCGCLILDGNLTCVGGFTYGDSIVGQEDCPDGYVFVSSVSPVGPACVLLSCPPIPHSCFTGETRIAMADGTSRPIELVVVGDHVLGQNGTNRVEVIERPPLGSRTLYALNDGPFFVTAEHPFLTEDGWKAIDPAATAAENPHLVVGRLAVGDRLRALARVPVLAGGGSAMEAVIPELTVVALVQIRETRADPATPLYNLRLDGDHTYVANELLVHNK